MGLAAIFILAAHAAVLAFAASDSGVVALFAFFVTGFWIVTVRARALRRSRREHEARRRAVAAWEAENEGKARKNWSPFP